MKEYFVEKPMPQFGKDIYSCIPIPNEIVAEIKADAIDECKSIVMQTLDNEMLVDTLLLRMDELKEQNK